MNILTFDTEEWYLERVLYGGRDFKYRQYDDAFSRLLNDLEQYNIKATFFCLGQLANERPDVIKRIAEKGHEVGCHSNEHTWLTKMDEQSLKKDTIDSIKALEDVTGNKVVSYRAPAFSITPENIWALRVLTECGIENDSSIFPLTRDFGGYPSFPQDTPCIISNEGLRIKEYPISMTIVMGKKMAYSGGGYFRVLPYWLVKEKVNNNNYNICYFHLNDLIKQKIAFKSKAEYEEYFKEPGTLKNRLVRYVKSNVGNGDAYGKLVRLLSEHQFINIQEADKHIDWNEVKTVQL